MLRKQQTEDRRIAAAKTFEGIKTKERSEQKVEVVYVVNFLIDNISIIDISTQQVTTIPVGESPVDVKFTPDGTKAYVTNCGSDDISVIDTATQQVLATISYGESADGYCHGIHEVQGSSGVHP
jgi:YVTN family beta-propeller protein